MKTRKIISILAATAMASAVFADPSLTAEKKNEISTGLNDFAKVLVFAVPEASTQQNVWGDAYIGNLYPSIFPHFGVGFSIGGTYLDTRGLKKASGALFGDKTMLSATDLGSSGNQYVDSIAEKINLEIPESFVLPTATVDVRIGGVVLPFDIGICAMMTNPSLFTVDIKDPSSVLNVSKAMQFDLFGFKGSIDYLTIGADLRYRFFEGSSFVPIISVGGGYYYTKGSFKLGATDTREVTVGSRTGNQTTNAEMATAFESHVGFAQIQISKEIGFVNLFLGARGTLSNTTVNWAWKYDTSNDNPSIDATASDSQMGSVQVNSASESWNNGVWNMTEIQPQIFGGIGFNIWKVQLTLGACVDMRSMFDKPNYEEFIWSGFFSTHFKF